MYLAGGDDLQHYGGTSTRQPADKGLICANTVSSDPAVTGMWYTLYSGINRANMFLENIDRVNDISDEQKAQYIAEARFLRAFYYFTLVQNWGDVPFKTESTNTVDNLSLPRTDREKIYDFIVTEMSEAADEEKEACYMPVNWDISLDEFLVLQPGESWQEYTCSVQENIIE